MEGKIVHKGTTKNGKEFEIRYPKISDLLELLEYINTLSKEQTFIRLQGEQLTKEEETEYLSGQIKKIKLKKSVELFVICEGKIVGVSNIDLKDKIEKHEGVLGISIASDYRALGIGKALLKVIIKEAEENLPELRIITLGVFENNDIAHEIYKKLGFFEYGRLKDGIFYKGKYLDHIYLFKKIR